MPSTTSPAASGFRMPAEWAPHAGCLMAWPSRAELWGARLPAAKRDYASVAAAIARFEPVVMVCSPGHAGEVRSLCGVGVTPLEIPINDSWSRDSGPAFVRNASGEIAVVGFGFNAWGNRWHPHDDDARLGLRIAEWLHLPFFAAPFVLEGGSFFVDGEGTVITTEQCLLNPNRNPHLSQAEIEQGLKDHLGATTVIWLPFGHSLDTGPAGTDGHVDGVLQYVAPGRVMLELVDDPASPEHDRGMANLTVLRGVRDAAGRTLEIEILDPGAEATVSYANHYLANGAVIVPVAGSGEEDGPALTALQTMYPHREVVGVPGATLAFGGGGPHCITQQIPAGVELPVGRAT
ncbi:MAG: agmatine deiminase family protein [Ilumatobacteraceae bacterium]